MFQIATNNRKNIVVPQVYSKINPKNEVFRGKWPLLGKIVVSYMVPNVRDQELRLEGSKMRPRPKLCILRQRH